MWCVCFRVVLLASPSCRPPVEIRPFIGGKKTNKLHPSSSLGGFRALHLQLLQIFSCLIAISVEVRKDSFGNLLIVFSHILS